MAASDDRARSNVPYPSDATPRETDGKTADGALIDQETGFATSRAWAQVFRLEEQRFARYGRPVTVLVAEIEGLDSLASILGQDAADRLIAPVAAAMRRTARDSDFLARIAHARFVAMLPETDEVAAINYAERVSSACDMWLEAGGVGVRVAFGWAQPIAGGRLSDAMSVAYDRMNADRRRQSLRAAPSTATPSPTAEDAPVDAGNPGLREGRSGDISQLRRRLGGNSRDAA